MLRIRCAGDDLGAHFSDFSTFGILDFVTSPTSVMVAVKKQVADSLEFLTKITCDDLRVLESSLERLDIQDDWYSVYDSLLDKDLFAFALAGILLEIALPCFLR